MSKILYYTKSLCPVCFKEIYAQIVVENNKIYMVKECREHGFYKTLTWDDTEEKYLKWLSYGGLEVEKLPKSEIELDNIMKGGFESIVDNPSQPVSAALMTTSLCNAKCPVCFTRDSNRYLPSIEECKAQLEKYKEFAGEGAPLEFCGGEPTVRKDLCELANIARDMGFNYIQLNTNGFKIAQNLDYAIKLKESGITTIYLGYDGDNEESYITKYGENVLPLKYKAVENAKKSGLAVVLVPCLIPGSNDDRLKDIIDFAKKNIPTVKGVYIQPVSYFGSYPKDYKKIRLTIPQVLRKLEEQTNGEIKKVDFMPGGCEHPQCSFNAYYMLDKKGVLRAFTQFKQITKNNVESVRNNAKKIWSPSMSHGLSIGGMAFMDVWNIDLLRVKKCTVQIITKDYKTVSLCAKYITSEDGSMFIPGIN
ncbi:MAG: radical SAM protein [Pleomorphochaeta sp.]